MRVTIVVLAKYPEVFAEFLRTVEIYEPNTPKVLVRDGFDIPSDFMCGLSTWKLIQGPDKFSMAGNGNLGLRAVDEGSDILYCGDDVRFTTPTVQHLHDAAYSDPHVGILSPKLVGRGTDIQMQPWAYITETTPNLLWFPCVYIKRALINRIGYLDESFSEFGKDDLDYSIRARQAGYKLAVTNAVSVIHEGSPEGGPTTFDKTLGAAERNRQCEAALDKLKAKYGDGWEGLL